MSVVTLPRARSIAGHWRHGWQALQKLTENWQTFDGAAKMTLLLLLIYSGSDWYLKRPITIEVAAGLLYPPLRRSKLFWLVVMLTLAASNWHNWYHIDNHKYLMMYWCLAFFLACFTADPGKTLAHNARLLIGLAFLFATFWKATSADYLDGTFFHHTLLLDNRFAHVAAFVTGLSQQTLVQNDLAVDSLKAYDSTLQFVQIQDTPLIPWLAQFLTWWTIVLEGLVAIAFLWPEGRFISKWRDFFLLTFLLTSYSIAPIVGFGWTLIIMGITQCAATWLYTRPLYVCTFFIQQIYLVPWKNYLPGFMG